MDVLPGQSFPLGASPGRGGVNFSVFSDRAQALELLLFDHVDATRPARVIALDAHRHRTAHYWHVFEDAFKVGKTCLGWEEVQVLAYDAVRLLVALGWVAAGFLDELGVTLEWPEVRLVRRLGGREDRLNRPVGKIVLMRGPRRLLDHLVTETILADEVRQHGHLPPRIAALLRRPVTG
jgi:hypothetical protein